MARLTCAAAAVRVISDSHLERTKGNESGEQDRVAEGQEVKIRFTHTTLEQVFTYKSIMKVLHSRKVE